MLKKQAWNLSNKTSYLRDDQIASSVMTLVSSYKSLSIMQGHSWQILKYIVKKCNFMRIKSQLKKKKKVIKTLKHLYEQKTFS